MSNVTNPSNAPGDMPWHRWQDWVNLILGIWLFIAPWVWHGAVSPSWDAWVLGVIVVVMSLWALSMPNMAFPEWINVIAGIWLFIAPWVLGFYSASHAPAWNQWVIGVIVFILSVSVASRFGGTHQTPRHLPTS
ncbi:MAG TPA: SPW repeat protein [Capsulimonadaceae bacterium]|nr:SPW repeat protein [Capsulimonadaceae bacterium]